MPRSSPDGVAETVALRRPCTVVTEAGPSTSATVARVSSGTMPVGVGTSSADSVSIVVGGFSVSR